MIISEANYLEAIDLLNDFFKGKQTREHVGIKAHWIRDEQVTENGYTYIKPIFEERDTYNVFYAEAQTHWLRNEKRPFKEPPFIAITDKWASNCLPLSNGDEILFHNEHLIVVTDICGTQYSRNFYQMSYIPNELINHMNHHILDKIYDSFYEYREEFQSYHLDNTEELIDIAQTIQDQIWKQIKDTIHDTHDITFTLTFNDKDIKVTINRKNFYDNGDQNNLFDFHTDKHIITHIVHLFGIASSKEEENIYDHAYWDDGDF